MKTFVCRILYLLNFKSASHSNRADLAIWISEDERVIFDLEVFHPIVQWYSVETHMLEYYEITVDLYFD